MPKGAQWLIRESPADEVFTPEKLSEDHRLIARTAQEFVANEVAPALPDLEKKNWTVARRLVARAGELGLLGVDVPEPLGGAGFDKAAAIVVGDAVGDAASFAMAYGAQAGLTMIPILCFGTPAQQQHYLPRIISGELIGAYCLSESGSGSDALAARAKAVKQADGSWLLTGEKMWITNGGFADLFIVFAKVDGEHFSAFIVERGFPGVTNGKEEHKMGLHGSSTTPLVLQDAKVPGANLLGEVGKGHKIAFNVLNYGRFKLAATCTGVARATIGEAVRYALGRRQFGQPIASFGAIRSKLAEMTLRLYAVESMLFRTTGLIDRAIAASGTHDDGQAIAAALEEFAIEASLLKVAGSEMADFVVDENVQIHGGNGFVGDYPAERRYRDARVNRIFEGTNEINRLILPATLIKRGTKANPGLIDAMQAVRHDEVTAAPQDVATSLRQTVLLAVGLAMDTHGDNLPKEQETLMALADLMIDAFGADSATLRASQAAAISHPLAALHADAASVIAHDAGLRAEATARTLFASMLNGEAQRAALAALRRLLDVPPVNTIAARRRLADAVTSRRGYPFGA
ncbi:MAG TPA: acyl-CoA dehydrogenase family protein [Vicinamibacterales bacterium]|nr:acyl-CoA dehydrogenase family protein [Vicinamibacterales bacterium]